MYGNNMGLFACKFINNTANTGRNGELASSAGAIYTGGVATNILSDFTLINCEFTNNIAFNTTSGNGGAVVFVYCDNIVVSDCNFTNNKGRIGGGLRFSNGRNILIINSIFINNTAIGTNGGAIFHGGNTVDRSENLTLINCNFTNNIAVRYGGVMESYATNGFVTIINCNFVNNTAGTNGGAFYYWGKNIIVIDSNFTNNTATNGGALYADFSINTTINGCNFINNSTINGCNIQQWY